MIMFRLGTEPGMLDAWPVHDWPLSVTAAEDGLGLEISLNLMRRTPVPSR